jgi:hypothetical protein
MPKNNRNNSGGITVISRRRELKNDRLAAALAAYLLHRLNNPDTITGKQNGRRSA